MLNAFAYKFLGLWATDPPEKGIDSCKEGGVKGTDALSVSSLPSRVENDDSAIKASSAKIAQLMLESGAPGLVVSVSRRGRKIWEAAFGYCDVENELFCDAGARMRIASISKTLFATTVVAPMIEEGKIDLDAPIHKYLSPEEFPRPKYKGKEYDITIRQLLSHTGGISHYPECSEDYHNYQPIGSSSSLKLYQCSCQYHNIGYFQRETFRNVLDSLKLFKDEPLVKEPGEYQYSSNGYVLLSAVIQKAHQMDDKSKSEQIEDFWMKSLASNWGMRETILDQDEPLIPKRARYYLRNRHHGALANAPYTDNSCKWAGGGLNSSTSDLIKFGNLLIDSYKEREFAKLKRSTIDLLWKEVKNNYGLGFKVSTLEIRDGVKELAASHTGVAVGASSAFLILPQSEIVVAIMTNLGWVNMAPLSESIAREFGKAEIQP